MNTIIAEMHRTFPEAKATAAVEDYNMFDHVDATLNSISQSEALSVYTEAEIAEAVSILNGMI